MFLTIITSVLVTLWIIFCAIIYSYHYIVEVILDLPVSGQSPCTAHTALKQLIQRLLKESLDFPNLQKRDNSTDTTTPSDESKRTYEDLLATAILNKVINNSQNNLPSSSAASVSSQRSTSSRRHRSRNHSNEKEYFFGDETLNNKWKTTTTDPDTTSLSSLDEWIQSDSSVGSTKYVDRISLTIQQRIEEVSASDSDNEFLRAPKKHPSSVLLDDEDEGDSNWYLQKRQFHGTHSPVPVPMLVPHPTTDAKVLIGEREVDETSDLSDAMSDDDYGDVDSGVPSVKNLLLESRMVIGGKNLMVGNDNDDDGMESSGDSGVRADRDEDKPRADITIDDENVEDASIHSNGSHEKDTEYTERYASLTNTIVKSPEVSRRNSINILEDQPAVADLVLKHAADNVDGSETPKDADNPAEFDGRYSKREKEKWKNPVEMKNNPYSKENIEKRIQCKSSNLFGRDYYARQASLPSGTRKKDVEESDADDPQFKPQFFYGSNEDLDDIYYHAVPTEVVDNSSDITIETEPIIIEPAPPQNQPNSPPSSTNLQNVAAPVEDQSNSEITSDSDLSSYVNCYDVETSTVYKQSPSPPLPPSTVQVINNDDYDENCNVLSRKNLNCVNSDDVVVVPQIKPRLFPSSNGTNNTNNINKTTIPVAQKRNKIDDQQIINGEPDGIGFYNSTAQLSTTIINQKSDNTLIKKIYSDPRVRSFALISRDQIPSIDYNRNRNTDAFGQIASKDAKIKPSTPVAAIPTPDEIESTLDQVMETHRNLTRTMSSLYNSDDDFLSDSRQTFSLDLSEDDDHIPSLKQRPGSSANQRDPPEISALKEQRLVASRLGQFSKSFPNLSKINSTVQSGGKTHDDGDSAYHHSYDFTGSSVNISDGGGGFVDGQISVRDLKKKFESKNMMHRKDKPVHSLTARSISKPVREQLKNQENIEVTSTELGNYQPNSIQLEIEEVPLIAEDRIKFYELLKK